MKNPHLAALLICALSTVPVSAAPIAGIGIQHWDGSLTSIDNFTPVAGSTTQTYSASDLIAGTNLTYGYSTTAIASLTALSAIASANLISGATVFPGTPPNLIPTKYAYALATAGFLDRVTIAATGQSGAGFLYLTFQVNGTASATNPLVDAFGQVGANSAGGSSFRNLGSGTGSVTLTPINIQFGVPLDILFYLDSQVKFNMSSPVDGAGGTADFSHTASFPSFLITDAENRPLYEASVVSQQGQVYAVATPEPATASIAMAALLAGMLMRKSRRPVA